MAIGDIYQVRSESQYLTTEQSVNVYYYQQTAGAAANPASQLAVGFNNLVLPDVADASPAHVTYTDTTVINYGNVTDSAVTSPNIQGTLGTISDAVAPPFLGWTVRQPPSLPGQNYSYKRYPVIRALDLTANGQLSVGFLSLASIVALRLALVVTQGGNTYSPVQVTGAKILGTPLTFARSLTGGWQFNRFPTTQSSRKDAFRVWAVIP